MSSKSFKELMKRRYSARGFLPKPIPEDVLKDIISTSLLTPSWGNTQPWHIHVACGKTLEAIRNEWIAQNKEGVKGHSDLKAGHRTDFSQKCQENIAKAIKRFDEVLKDPKAAKVWEANSRMFDSPTVVYITVPKTRTEYCVFDCGAIEMAIMMAAMEHDVDTIAAYELIKYPDILRKHLKIPDDEDILIGISLGYEDKDNILSKIKQDKFNLEQACNFYN